MAKRICRECGEEFGAKREHALFCGAACRAAFNNRRAMRGAEVYDLLMALRHQRGAAKALGIWRLLCRLASRYRAEDVKEREGRASWMSPQRVKARHLADVSTSGRV